MDAALKSKSGEYGKPPEDGASGPSETPEMKPKAEKQRNFPDPDSRIMLDGPTKAFTQAYNAQAAVDCDSQVIACADVFQQANDKQQLVPMLEQIEENLGPRSRRCRVFSEEAVGSVADRFTEPFIPRQRVKHDDPPQPAPRG